MNVPIECPSDLAYAMNLSIFPHEQNNDSVAVGDGDIISKHSPLSIKNKSESNTFINHLSDTSIVSNDDQSSDSSEDEELNDAVIVGSTSALAPKSLTSSKKTVKRVTWYGLDKLDYVPTRTPGSRKRSLRRSRTNARKAKKAVLATARKAEVKKKTPFQEKEETKTRKGETVKIIQMRTGTLFMYRGPNRRVVFKRK